MRITYFLFACAGFLLLGLLDLPIGYYTFLRIIVTIGSIAIIVNDINVKPSIWALMFGIITILFNPIFPVYLNDKEAWAVIDIITAILFLVKAFSIKTSNT